MGRKWWLPARPVGAASTTAYMQLAATLGSQSLNGLLSLLTIQLTILLTLEVASLLSVLSTLLTLQTVLTALAVVGPQGVTSCV